MLYAICAVLDFCLLRTCRWKVAKDFIFDCKYLIYDSSNRTVKKIEKREIT